MRTHTLLLSFRTLEVNTAAVGSVLRFFLLHRTTLRLAHSTLVAAVKARRSSSRPSFTARWLDVGSGLRPDHGAHERVRSRLSRRLQSCALVSGVFHPRPQGANVFPIAVSTTMSHPPRAHSPRSRRLLSSAFCWSWSPRSLSRVPTLRARGFHCAGFLLQFGGRARRVSFFLQPSTVLCGRPLCRRNLLEQLWRYTPQCNPPSLAFLPAPTSNLFVSRIRTLFQLKFLSALLRHQRLRLAASAPSLWEIIFKLSPFLGASVALFSSVFR
ncbi:hypothetical protein B0H11DRAFT_2020551 [Mycena galericulata]|nr:hypothetical protein B0H11DRAFT_2020551 [Mycena galericulata]